MDDPYRILGVGRDATDVEIRRAYERRLSEAADAGALRAAQSVDAAYSVLRDPQRRALFDRNGLVVDLPRLPSRASAVPFRSWSPQGGRAQPRSRRGQPLHIWESG